jgi:monothiol glutaredoxin
LLIKKGATVETIEKIKKQISDNTILLYMKGSPKMPQCGFSARAVQCIDACGVNFAFVDILANPDIRQTLPQYADWPTFPQLYVKGELIGGSDIIAEMYEQGELELLLREATAA